MIYGGNIRIKGEILDGSRRPIEGATVQLGPHQCGSPIGPVTQTNSEGEFEFINISEEVSWRSEGKILLVVTAHEFAPAFVELSPGSQLSNVRIALEQPRRLCGRIVDI